MAGEQYGHIKISRKAFADDPFWKERRVFSRWEAWEDLIQMAAWKPRRIAVGGGSVALERGELLGSIRFLSSRWSWTDKRVRTFLESCRQDDRISIQQKTLEGHTYLVVNYERYQSGGHSRGTAKGIGEGIAEAQQRHSDVVENSNTYGDEGHSRGTAKAQRWASKGHKENTSKANNINTSPTDLLFDALWFEYPRKVGKQKALTAWKKAIVRGDPKAIDAGVRRYVAYVAAQETEERYIKHLSTLINSGEWQDEWTVPGVTPLRSKAVVEEWWQNEEVV